MLPIYGEDLSTLLLFSISVASSLFYPEKVLLVQHQSDRSRLDELVENQDTHFRHNMPATSLYSQNFHYDFITVCFMT
jgi:hypothetical protein